MLNINPMIKITKISKYFNMDPEDSSIYDGLITRDEIEKIIENSDLLISCSGYRIIDLMLNEICVLKKKIFITGGLLERAIMGYIFRYIPGETHCYNCVSNYILPKLLDFTEIKIYSYCISSRSPK